MFFEGIERHGVNITLINAELTLSCYSRSTDDLASPVRTCAKIALPGLVMRGIIHNPILIW
jgi:hypothetical protein